MALSATTTTTTTERWRASDEQRALVEANCGLVRHYVKRRHGAACPNFDDLVQVGMFGLMRAAIKYDPTRGTKFSTYAVAAIRRTINRHFVEDGLIRVPIFAATSSKFAPLAVRARSVVSLDNRRDGDDLGFDPADDADEDLDEAIDGTEANERLTGWLDHLSARDREMITLRFGLRGDPPLTLKQVGERFGITKERVRQIEERTLADLRYFAGAS